MARSRSGPAWGALAAGLASALTLPLAIYLTRLSGAYELLHAGFAIPVAAGLGFLAVSLARRTRRRGVLGLEQGRRVRIAGTGRFLGIVGLCMACAALVALGVYAVLEYVGGRD